MSSLHEVSNCLICKKQLEIMVSLDQNLNECESLTVAQVLQNLHFLTIPDLERLGPVLCYICVAKVQSCFDFKTQCYQIGRELESTFSGSSAVSSLRPVDATKPNTINDNYSFEENSIENDNLSKAYEIAEVKEEMNVEEIENISTSCEMKIEVVENITLIEEDECKYISEILPLNDMTSNTINDEPLEENTIANLSQSGEIDEVKEEINVEDIENLSINRETVMQKMDFADDFELKFEMNIVENILKIEKDIILEDEKFTEKTEPFEPTLINQNSNDCDVCNESFNESTVLVCHKRQNSIENDNICESKEIADVPEETNIANIKNLSTNMENNSPKVHLEMPSEMKTGIETVENISTNQKDQIIEDKYKYISEVPPFESIKKSSPKTSNTGPVEKNSIEHGNPGDNSSKLAEVRSEINVEVEILSTNMETNNIQTNNIEPVKENTIESDSNKIAEVADIKNLPTNMENDSPEVHLEKTSEMKTGIEIVENILTNQKDQIIEDKYKYIFEIPPLVPIEKSSHKTINNGPLEKKSPEKCNLSDSKIIAQVQREVNVKDIKNISTNMEPIILNMSLADNFEMLNLVARCKYISQVPPLVPIKKSSPKTPNTGPVEKNSIAHGNPGENSGKVAEVQREINVEVEILSTNMETNNIQTDNIEPVKENSIEGDSNKIAEVPEEMNVEDIEIVIQEINVVENSKTKTKVDDVENISVIKNDESLMQPIKSKSNARQCIKFKSFDCEICGKSFASLRKLRKHEEIHTKGSYKCNVCSKVYKLKRGLEKHKRSHKNKKEYVCYVCNISFSYLRELILHVRNHPKGPYVCDVCFKVYKHKKGLEKHQKFHTGERAHVCDVCNKAYPVANKLVSHIRVHTGEKPYICEVCGKAFSWRRHLTDHQRIHSGECPYVCDVCGKGFKESVQLTIHQKTHTRVRPYVCDVCDKAYTTASHLKIHKREVHSLRRPFACPVCRRTFHRLANLREHLNLHE